MVSQDYKIYSVFGFKTSNINQFYEKYGKSEQIGSFLKIKD